MNLAPLVAFGLGGNHSNYITAHAFTLMPDTGTKPVPPPIITGGGTVFAPGTYKDSWKVVDHPYLLQPNRREHLVTIKIQYQEHTLCDRTYRLGERQLSQPTVGVVVPTLISTTLVVPKLITTEFLK